VKLLLTCFTFLIAALLPVLSAKAQQPCNNETIMAVKGKWSTSSNNVVNPDKTFPSNQFNQIYTRLDKIARLFQEAYPQPMGMEARWYRSINGAALVKNGPVPYQFNSLYLLWYCNQNLNKLMLGSETGTWAYIFINDLHWFLSEVKELKIENTSLYLLPEKIGQWEGMSLYDGGSSQFKEHRAVLITRPGQLPYKPVSRLQYLLSLKKKIEEDKNVQLEIDRKLPVKTEMEEEKTKQEGLENIAKTNRAERVEQRKSDYLKNYKTDKQRKEETIQRSENFFNDRLKIVIEALNSGDQEDLQQLAIVDKNSIIFFKGFSTEDEGGKMMALINADYFNLKLPRYAPQCMVLYWRSESNNKAPSQLFKKMFESNFPVDKLRHLIDK